MATTQGVSGEGRCGSDDLRSSVSVVSDSASTDDAARQPQRKMKEEQSQLGPPKKGYHPGNPANKSMQRRQSEERASGTSLMATLRSSIETFEHPRSSNIRNSQNSFISDHRPLYVDIPSSYHSGETASTAFSTDLEPLPFRHESAGVKNEFHDSHSTEQSFEEAMDDFELEMGVPV